MGWVVWDVGQAGEVNGIDTKGGGRGDTIDGVCLSDVCERGIEGQSFVDGYSH
jgi:hypothetical protein